MDILKSPEINEFAAALSKAQSEIIGARKEALNPFFGKAYADLSSVWDAVRGPLTKNNLSISQVPIETERGTAIRTFLMHSSGQWIAGDLLIKPLKPDPQSTGSALTYARRYALASMTGVPTIDDDGNSANDRKGKHEAVGKPRESLPIHPTDPFEDDLFPNESGNPDQHSDVGTQRGRQTTSRGSHSPSVATSDQGNITERMTKAFKGMVPDQIWKEHPVLATKFATEIRKEILDSKQKVDEKLIKFFEYGVVKGFMKELPSG